MKEQLAFLETLFTPLVSDVMDTMGLSGYVLPHSIQSVFFDPHIKVAGIAYPAQVIATDEYVEIDTLLEMVDSIPEDAFVLVASDKDIDAALWGGLMSTRAKVRGARAAAVTGGVRDIEQIAGLSFPVWGKYRCVKDIRRRGYMAKYNISVTIDGVPISPGDIVFADANGIVILPLQKSGEIIQKVHERIVGEIKTADGLNMGKSAKELFADFSTF